MARETRQHDIIAIGTSAGGVSALQEIVGGLPQNFPASVFVVMHLPPRAQSYLPQVLSRAGRLPCVAVQQTTRFQPGRVYVAPPDQHIILTRTDVRLSGGPRENWHRPSIDVLFRSAAMALGPRVVGVVLTGFMDDGTAGLAAIKKEGGLAIVQDPEEATFPDMPSSALRGVEVDYCLPLRKIPRTLVKVLHRPVGTREGTGLSEEVAIESQFANRSMNGRNDLEKIGTPSTFTCPECQGPLWEIRDGKLTHFRCQVGHAFSASTMLSGQQDVVERSLWVALGAIQSRAALWRKLADRMKGPEMSEVIRFYRAKERAAVRDIEVLRRLLQREPESSRESLPRSKRSPERPWKKDLSRRGSSSRALASERAASQRSSSR